MPSFGVQYWRHGLASTSGVGRGRLKKKNDGGEDGTEEGYSHTRAEGQKAEKGGLAGLAGIAGRHSSAYVWLSASDLAGPDHSVM